MTFEFPCVGCSLIFRTESEFDGHVMWRFGKEGELIGFALLLEQFLNRGIVISSEEAYRVADIVDASLSEDAFDEMTQMFRLELGIVDASELKKASSRAKLLQRYRSEWFRLFVLRIWSERFPDVQIGLSDSECIDALLDSFLNSGEVHRQRIIERLFAVENVRLQDLISPGKKISEKTRKAVQYILDHGLRGKKAAETFDALGGDHFQPKTAMQLYKEGSWTGALDNLKRQVGRRALREHKTPGPV